MCPPTLVCLFARRTMAIAFQPFVIDDPLDRVLPFPRFLRVDVGLHVHGELLAMVCGVAMAAACGCFWTDCMRRSRRLHPPARAACRRTARSCYHAAEEA